MPALPFARFAYRSPALHLFLETLAGLIGLLAAYLVFGRLRRSSAAGDLALVLALAIFGVTNLCFSAVPLALSDLHRGSFSTWAPLVGRVLGAGLLTAAAFAGERRLRRPARATAMALVACFAALAGIGVAAATLGGSLPTGVDPGLSPEASGRPLIVGHPVVLAAQLVAVALFAAAAVGFERRALRTGDELLTWFAAGATLAAFARVNYFLFPSLFSEWVYTGDVLRLGFYLVLLVGAAREIRGYWRSVTAAAVLEERRRIARDVHDGLAQELAFIAAQSGRLSNRREREGELAQIASAAERALGESRRAIAALSRAPDEPLALVLRQVAGELAERRGVTLELDLDDRVDVPPAAREALARIVREAVTNACRHGNASVVRIELAAGSGLVLRVVDNGSGFDPDRVDTSGAGFGLTSMRQRSEALGGSVRIEGRPGEGAAVEIRLP